jgi:parallel beta-helix repeat protein
MRRLSLRSCAVPVLGVLTVAFLFGVPGRARAAVCTVPDGYPTIQAALDACRVGDTVFVRSSAYYEHLTITKQQTLMGEDRAATVVDGGGSGTVVHVTGVSNARICGLTITNGTDGIHLDNSHYNEVEDCLISSNYRHGIHIYPHSSHNTIAFCDIVDNTKTPGSSYDAVCLGDFQHQEYNTIADCNVYSNNGQGIVGYITTDYTVVTRCNVHDNASHGIVAGWSRWTISDCNVYSNGTGGAGSGIALDTAGNTAVSGCDVYANTNNGVLIGGLGNEYCQIISNLIHSNSAGIMINSACRYSTFIDNAIYENEYGICIGKQSTYVNRDNTLYHNEFTDNTVSVQNDEDRYSNTWDDGYPSGGNYWSDYTGVDLYSGPAQDTPPNDGIGDTPYVINALNRDNYPVVKCIDVVVGDVVTAGDGEIQVPIDVSDLTDRGVTSAEVLMAYDPTVLDATGFETAGTLVAGAGWSLTWNVVAPGVSKVSMAGVNDLSGAGTIIILTFEVADGAPCPGCTNLEPEMMFNEGDPCALVSATGEYCLPTERISGTLRYFGCPALGNVNPPIPNVEVLIDSGLTPPPSPVLMATTDSAGAYSFQVCVDSCYRATPVKEGGEVLGISSMDASLALRYTVARETLTDCPVYPMLMPDRITWCPDDTVYAQRVAADVSGNGNITAYDASLILKYVVGLDGGNCGEWVFYCGRREYCPAEQGLAGQDYVGVLLGDASGSWRPGGGLFAAGKASADLSVSDATAAPGEVVSVPIHLDTDAQLFSLDFKVFHDPELASVDAVRCGQMAEGWQLAYNNLAGETRIALAGIDEISGSGDLAIIDYRVAAEPPVDQCQLEPGDIVADEGRVSVEGHGGILALEGASVDGAAGQAAFRTWISPNPSTREVAIRFALPHESTVRVSVYDATGRLIAVVVDDEVRPAGNGTSVWNGYSWTGSQVSPGVYFIRVMACGRSDTHRVVLLD